MRTAPGEGAVVGSGCEEAESPAGRVTRQDLVEASVFDLRDDAPPERLDVGAMRPHHLLAGESLQLSQAASRARR